MNKKIISILSIVMTNCFAQAFAADTIVNQNLKQQIEDVFVSFRADNYHQAHRRGVAEFQKFLEMHAECKAHKGCQGRQKCHKSRMIGSAHFANTVADVCNAYNNSSEEEKNAILVIAKEKLEQTMQKRHTRSSFKRNAENQVVQIENQEIQQLEAQSQEQNVEQQLEVQSQEQSRSPEVEQQLRANAQAKLRAKKEAALREEAALISNMMMKSKENHRALIRKNEINQKFQERREEILNSREEINSNSEEVQNNSGENLNNPEEAQNNSRENLNNLEEVQNQQFSPSQDNDLTIDNRNANFQQIEDSQTNIQNKIYKFADAETKENQFTDIFKRFFREFTQELPTEQISTLVLNEKILKQKMFDCFMESNPELKHCKTPHKTKIDVIERTNGSTEKKVNIFNNNF